MSFTSQNCQFCDIVFVDSKRPQEPAVRPAKAVTPKDLHLCTGREHDMLEFDVIGIYRERDIDVRVYQQPPPPQQ